MALATANPTLSRTAAATRPGNAWAWSGLATLVIGFAFTWAPVLFGISDAEAKDPDRLFAALDTTTNLWLGRVTSGLGFLTVAALLVFANGYRRFLRVRMPDSLVPDVAYTALVATAGALIIASVFRAMLFDSIDSYDNSMHATMYALSWDVSLASWTVGFVAAAASAVAAFRGVLPKWFGWASVILSGLAVLLAMTGLSFPAHLPVFIWLLCATIVSLRNSSEVRA
jgi:hypothetical protein